MWIRFLYTVYFEYLGLWTDIRPLAALPANITVLMGTVTENKIGRKKYKILDNMFD